MVVACWVVRRRRSDYRAVDGVVEVVVGVGTERFAREGWVTLGDLGVADGCVGHGGLEEMLWVDRSVVVDVDSAKHEVDTARNP